MRLLVIVNVYRPDLGGGVLFADFCEGLAARGFQVEVRCAYPYYPEWKDKTGRNGLAIQETLEQGVRVRRHGIFIPRRPSRLLDRLAYEASFFGSLSRDLPGPGTYDLVMAYCPLVGSVAFGAIAAATARCPLWVNVQDLSAQAAEAAGIVRSRRLGSVLGALQGWLFRRASILSTIAPSMKARLEPFAAGRPVHCLPNWLHGSLARAIAKASPSPDRDGPVRLLYSGNIGGKQDLLRFCTHLADSDAEFRFRIQGDGTEGATLRNWMTRTEDSRFELVPLSDENGLANALKITDLFVITEKSGSGGSFIPSKLLPALGASTAVLAVCDADSPLGMEMSESRAGLAVRWNELDEVTRWVANPDRLRDVLPAWMDAAEERFKHFDRERILDQYATLLRQAVPSNP